MMRTGILLPPGGDFQKQEKVRGPHGLVSMSLSSTPSDLCLDVVSHVVPPAWALWERYILDTTSRLAVEFVERYTRPDGTLIWRDEWPGMDGSDDGYESFFNFPLLYALGGDEAVDEIARREWEAITRQFTGYGQVYREFDGYYDWMHHGESSTYFYFFGLSNPYDPVMKARALRFADMYTGDDPDAQNYDPDHNIIRSPINGSRGPRFENTPEDWVTHRPVLAHYPPPFEDIPGVKGPTADWTDDEVFKKILGRLNERMMRGDVPLNLNATSLVANAFMYTHDNRYLQWITAYVRGWMERAVDNGGIIPDNVGLSGKIGEYMHGKWWGGYYGWRWPHGLPTIGEPVMVGAANACLLSGDLSYLDLPRSQLDQLFQRAHEENGVLKAPHRRGDTGFYDYRRLDPTVPIHLWYMSMDPQDKERLHKWYGNEDWNVVHKHRGKGDVSHANCWYNFIEGKNPSYPETICRCNYDEICRRMELIRNDTADLTRVDVHHWQGKNPVVIESLVQLMLGSPYIIYHGGLLHTRLRYFDGQKKRPGVPDSIAALVSRVEPGGVDVELINLSPAEERQVILQSGNFAEHRFTGVTAVEKESGSVVEKGKLNSPHLIVNLKPGTGILLKIAMDRFVNTPTYAFPWDQNR